MTAVSLEMSDEPDIIKDEEMEYLKDANERQTRLFVAIIANRHGKMVPYGIYDVKRNTGYMTFGVSHDTAEFACECFARQWEENLRHIYPSAKSILILCDGGGSNNARSWQFKWCLIQLAKRLGIDIRIAH